MGKRGRPPHPDILTPREWQVLDLLRRDLTNEQIAQRLDISPATAKYHVSEILSKLGVQTREEAAAWQPDVEPARPWWAATRWFAPLTVTKGAIIVGGVAAVAGLAVLAWAATRTEGDDTRAAPITATEPAIEIAYAGEGGFLHLASATGDVRELDIRCDSAVLWSPDGEHLACQSGAGGGPLLKTTVLDVEGSVVASFEADGGSLTWAPVAELYAYTRTLSDQTDLFRGFSDPEVSSVALASHPVWLPDGRLAAYRPVEASIGPEPYSGIDIYTGNEAFFRPVGDYRPLAAVHSAGATTLLVAGNLTNPGQASGPTFVAALLDIATLEITPVPELDDEPHIWVSPDGSFGVFPTPSTDGLGLSIVDFESLEVRPIAGSAISFPSDYIPRQHVAFNAESTDVYWADARSPLDIYRASLAGGPAELLAFNPTAGRLAFAPGFIRIAYLVGGAPPQLWTSDIKNGANPHQLGAVSNAFAWRPSRTPASPATITAPETVIDSSQQALDLVLHNLRAQGSLQPDESPDVTVQEMLYAEAVERAREFGVTLYIEPEGYVCPGGCPHPGKPAGSRGWLIVVRQLIDGRPETAATGYLHWIGEDGSMTIGGIR